MKNPTFSNTKTAQNPAVLLFANHVRAICDLPMKNHDKILSALVKYLILGIAPDFNDYGLRDKQLAKAIWTAILPTLDHSRTLFTNDKVLTEIYDKPRPKNNRQQTPSCVGAHVPAHASEEKENGIEKEIENEKEESFSADAVASVSSAPADDATCQQADNQTSPSSPLQETRGANSTGVTVDHTAKSTLNTKPTDAKSADAKPCPPLSTGLTSLTSLTSLPKPPADQKLPVEEIRRYFNIQVEQRGIPPIKSLKGKRLKTMKARIREYGTDALASVINKASDSQFLNGNNRNGFVATFDWLMRPDNFIKVWDGNYDDLHVSQSTF